LIDNLTGVDTTVLIEGETGTGKELVARAIHNRSERRARPFVAVNCAGLTESLVSSQLFGHRRGSFTGAHQDSPGLFEAAEEACSFWMRLETSRCLCRRVCCECFRRGDNAPRRD
jgi:transcriptional regulator with GAF, ATPase, and Fis domain